jgi:hypothetical protein
VPAPLSALTPRKSGAGRRPPRVARRPSPLFCEHVLEHPVVEREVGDRGLEPPVLGFERLEAAGLVDIQPAVLGLPAVVSLLRDAVVAAGVGDSLARFDALEDVDDLLLAEPGLAHNEFSSVGYITGELSLLLHLFSGRRSKIIL